MMFCLYSVVAAISIELALAQAQGAATRSDGLPLSLEAIVNAADGLELTEADRILFGPAEHRMLRDLTTHSNDGVAIRAAWELLLRTIEIQDSPPGTNPQAIRINARAVQRFLGFVEGRLQLTVPEAFESILHHGMTYGSDYISLNPGKYWKYAETPAKYYVPPGNWIADVDSQIVFSDGKKFCRLPAELSACGAAPMVGRRVSGIFTNDKLFIAFHSYMPMPYKLYCIDTASGRICWSVRVWVSGISGYSGNGAHSVALKLQGDVLYVFGATEDAYYIEGFSSLDGTPRLRFLAQ